MNAEIAARQKQERELEQAYACFTTTGFCFVCQKRTHFLSTWELAREIDGQLHVNWREHLWCRYCGLNNRMRASIHLLAATIAPAKEARIYATEESSPLYRRLGKSFPFLHGSEYLQDGGLRGTSGSPQFRHEDLTRLSFTTSSLDVILCFDVLEHIPDYRAAFSECARILKPTGKMLFSVPFDPNATCNLIRARLREDGTIQHLLAPEYHCDPRNPQGCLCFQCFGWEMFEQLQQAGFRNVWALCYYSPDYGYLGSEQLQFLAEK